MNECLHAGYTKSFTYIHSNIANHIFIHSVNSFVRIYITPLNRVASAIFGWWPKALGLFNNIRRHPSHSSLVSYFDAWHLKVPTRLGWCMRTRQIGATNLGGCEPTVLIRSQVHRRSTCRKDHTWCGCIDRVSSINCLLSLSWAISVGMITLA